MVSSSPNQLIWFRRNLRIANNPALEAAFDRSAASGIDMAKPLGVFCYDRQYTGTWLGMPRCGPLRAKFLWESVQNLRKKLQYIGSELVIQADEPEVLLPKLCQDLNITHVHTQRLFAHEETESAERVRRALEAIGVKLVQHECYTLLSTKHVREHHPEPFSSFSKFRRKVASPEDGVVVRELWHLKEHGVWHELLWHQAKKGARENGVRHHVLKVSPIPVNAYTDERAVLPFKGGETAGLQRLKVYAEQAVGHYKETRNGLIGADYSSKLSPWLNLGCISPAQVLQAVRKYEAENGANSSTEWLIVELLWRDFFQFLAAERGSHLFQGAAKPLGKVPELHDNDPNFIKVPELRDNDPDFIKVPELRDNDPNFWGGCAGKTDNEFLNANMCELAKTGYMSNRGRQNVASALIHDMAVDWRLGALWFEAQLLDYDPASNYGNWQYIAGLAANPRGGSSFNLKKQAQMYDPDGAYQKLWQA
ncbi:hypothetical protein CWE13_04785 [Aliidiomarina shirensis]|uniref:Cryptochrome DASH n=1 Tax=Aliidiomarina shirensis TaxID=1048642 RepID=A0A432WU40_9GAMM|nr:DASH family cryptochrome [Aliidiomarina shirensis]RUO37283.1 hypothetical protein CWE13_04785 [Aliidiomarina shirensis]